jgi:hypothetical protein
MYLVVGLVGHNTEDHRGRDEHRQAGEGDGQPLGRLVLVQVGEVDPVDAKMRELCFLSKSKMSNNEMLKK